jgi:hypothetical protein
MAALAEAVRLARRVDAAGGWTNPEKTTRDLAWLALVEDLKEMAA